MRVPVPAAICQTISERAAQFAREDIQSRGWSNKAISGLIPMPGAGTVGIKTTTKYLKYLIYQDRGIRPFIMWWVEGRRVPIHDKTGVHIVTGKDPGKPGWVTLPGGVRKWRDQKWRHPGLQPKNFMENAITKAIADARPQLKQELMKVLKGQY